MWKEILDKVRRRITVIVTYPSRLVTSRMVTLATHNDRVISRASMEYHGARSDTGEEAHEGKNEC